MRLFCQPSFLVSVRLQAIGLIAIWVGVMVFATSSEAQVRMNQPQGRSNPLPKANYYTVFPDLYQGEYRRAIKNYQSLLRSAYKDVNGPFLDSVCYLTMMGECHYHVGDYPKAVEAYEAAIKIYISRSAWEARTQVPAIIAPNQTAVARAKVSWFASKRTTSIGVFPRTYSYLLGRLDNERVLREGGAIQNPEARPVDVLEAMRCCALALHRRKELKGSTCKVDPLTTQFVQALTKQNLTSANVVGTWKGVLAGIALASAENNAKAVGYLKRSLQVAGRFDHPLTPVALCELGNLSMANGKYADAIQYFLEASHSAAVFEGVVSRGFT